MRELTVEDEKKFLPENRINIERNIPENPLLIIDEVMKCYYLTEIHRIPVETKIYPPNSWYGKARGEGEFVWVSFITSHYPTYQQDWYFLHILENKELKVWLHSYGFFKNGKLIEESDRQREREQWENANNSTLWAKIVEYYDKNKK